MRSPQSCRLPFLHSSQTGSDDLLALPARCPMSLAAAAASSRRMFCRWASGGVALNRGRGRLQASRCLRATSIATVASRSGAPSRRLRSSRRGRGPARDARTNRDRNQPAVRCSFASRSLPARHRTRRKNNRLLLMGSTFPFDCLICKTKPKYSNSSMGVTGLYLLWYLPIHVFPARAVSCW